MKKLILKIMVVMSVIGMSGCSSDPGKWSDEQINKWFDNGEWLNGWNVKPDQSINKKEFAIAYHKNPERWNAAFKFMTTNDLASLENKRYDIDGSNAYALVSQYMSKDEAQFEAHRKYVDIQYVVSGVEQMGMAPLSALKDSTVPYDETKDIEFMTVTDSIYRKATPENFLLFFPSTIHKPGMKVDQNTQIKKVVIKVKLD
ncbi:MAG TPA: YhcH/YjgK/YiaL family protein [Bacteroidales bacterium]|nr:YhcH/YjgK/YiaL family protein [Bacteroidales bacterium]